MARTYAENVAAIKGDTGISEERRQALLNQAQDQEYGSKAFDIGEFEELLGRLESSKGRQLRQKSTEDRRNTMTAGLAGMMNNFWCKNRLLILGPQLRVLT